MNGHKNSKKNSKSKDYFIYSVGRRRTASARIRIYPNHDQKGEIEINSKPAAQYFPGPLAEKMYTEPLRTTNVLSRYFISARVKGSGKKGQLDAFIHGLSRALVNADEEFKPIIKKRGFLTRDSRVRERRKVGMGGKSRRKKQSPKR